jgi:hypothetical protein
MINRKIINKIIKEWDDFFPIKDNNLDKNTYAIFRFLLYSLILILILSDNNLIKIILFILLIITFISLNLIESNNINNIIYEKEIKNFKKEKCRKSTINNPMSNILNTMEINELDMKICDENINTKQLIEDNLSYNIYSNSTDLFDRKTNKNNYITINTSYPNNTKKFKDFLYNFNENNCKTDGLMCRSYDDIRYHKNN